MTNRLNLWLAAICGAAVLLGQGALVSGQVRPGAKPKPNEPPPAAKKPVVPADDAKDAKDAAKERAKDAKDDAKDRVKDTKADAKDRAKDAKDDVKDRTKDAKDDAKDARDPKDRPRDPKDARDNPKDRARDPKDPRDDAKNTVKKPRDDAKADAKADAKVAAKGSARKFDAAKVKADDLGVTLKADNKDVVVSDVAKESILYNAGFRPGDQVVSINGQNLAGQNDFVSYLFPTNATTGRIPVVVMRNGARDTFYVRPQTLIRDYQRVVVTDDRRDPIRDFGLVLDNRYDDRLIVDRVLRDSRADAAGIKVDDEILAVNDRDVDSRNDLARTLEKYEAEPIEMEVRRDRAATVIEVKTLR